MPRPQMVLFAHQPDFQFNCRIFTSPFPLVQKIWTLEAWKRPQKRTQKSPKKRPFRAQYTPPTHPPETKSATPPYLEVLLGHSHPHLEPPFRFYLITWLLNVHAYDIFKTFPYAYFQTNINIGRFLILFFKTNCATDFLKFNLIYFYPYANIVTFPFLISLV